MSRAFKSIIAIYVPDGTLVKPHPIWRFPIGQIPIDTSRVESYRAKFVTACNLLNTRLYSDNASKGCYSWDENMGCWDLFTETWTSYQVHCPVTLPADIEVIDLCS